MEQREPEQPPPISSAKTNNLRDELHYVIDRRRSARFTLSLAIQCRCIERDLDQTIVGEVVNISSKGLLVKVTEALLPGQMVTAFIDWPAYLDKRILLQLVVEGRIMRRTGDCTAISIEKYEFRTHGIGRVAVKPAAAAATKLALSDQNPTPYSAATGQIASPGKRSPKRATRPAMLPGSISSS
jgi:hypothetical protein